MHILFTSSGRGSVVSHLKLERVLRVFYPITKYFTAYKRSFYSPADTLWFLTSYISWIDLFSSFSERRNYFNLWLFFLRYTFSESTRISVNTKYYQTYIKSCACNVNHLHIFLQSYIIACKIRNKVTVSSHSHFIYDFISVFLNKYDLLSDIRGKCYNYLAIETISTNVTPIRGDL